MLPPESLDELLDRARAIAGRTLGDLAREQGIDLADDGVRTKGKFGQLVERALGGAGSSKSEHDFPAIATELKTIPLGPRGPIESTYVCTLPLAATDTMTWEASWVRAKLARVLFVPVWSVDPAWRGRRIGNAVLFEPTEAQEAVLRADFEEVVGLCGAGRAEEVDARLGRWLQVRPKAANGRVRTTTRAEDGEIVSTIPRGFYLRTRFTGAVLRDPRATP